jgi:hypothetical protein
MNIEVVSYLFQMVCAIICCRHCIICGICLHLHRLQKTGLSTFQFIKIINSFYNVLKLLQKPESCFYFCFFVNFTGQSLGRNLQCRRREKQGKLCRLTNTTCESCVLCISRKLGGVRNSPTHGKNSHP